MAEFKDASLWMKLAMLFMVMAFGMHLFSMATPGWAINAGYTTNCNNNGKGNNNCSGGGSSWYEVVEAFEVIGFICAIVALMLALCLVLLDELKGNKIALICFVVFALVAGVAILIGVAYFGGKFNNYGEYSVMIAVFAAICAILAGIFGILEIVKGGK